MDENSIELDRRNEKEDHLSSGAGGHTDPAVRPSKMLGSEGRECDRRAGPSVSQTRPLPPSLTGGTLPAPKPQWRCWWGSEVQGEVIGGQAGKGDLGLRREQKP